MSTSTIAAECIDVQVQVNHDTPTHADKVTCTDLLETIDVSTSTIAAECIDVQVQVNHDTPTHADK